MSVQRVTHYHQSHKLIDLGEQMHRESSFAHLPYDRQALYRIADDTLARPDHLAWFYREEGDQVYAMVGVHRVPYYFAPAHFYVADFLLYVDQSKRGGMAAARCLKAAEAWARDIGADAVVMGVTANINNDLAERFYQALGYTRTGALMRKET